MTKDLVKAEEYAIMNPETNVADVIKLNLGGEALSISDLDHIKTPLGGTTLWNLPSIDGDESMKEFNAIIIHSQLQRTYWEDSFTGKGTPPDCFSNDAVIGIGKPGGECASCQWNEFGTSKSGRGKACATKRVMFLIRPQSMLPIMLRVPVGSLKNSRKYLAALASGNQKVYSVITRFSLEKTSNKDGIEFSRVLFSRVSAVDDITAVEAYADTMKPYLEQAAQKVDLGKPSD